MSRDRRGMPAGVEAILTALVQIESVNPHLAGGGAGEGAIAAWVAHFCEARGIAHRLEAVERDRPNVLAWVPGSDPDVRLLFEAHLDTMPAPGWSRDPFGAERDGPRLYGRGACDTKASLAAMLQGPGSIDQAHTTEESVELPEVEAVAGIYRRIMLAY